MPGVSHGSHKGLQKGCGKREVCVKRASGAGLDKRLMEPCPPQEVIGGEIERIVRGWGAWPGFGWTGFVPSECGFWI